MRQPIETESGPIRRVHRMGVTRRIIHWANVLAVSVAVVTGLYIADPYYSSRVTHVMSVNRALHFYAAIVLDVTVLVTAYLYLFSREERAIVIHWPSARNRHRLVEAVLNLATFDRRRRFDTSHPDPLNALFFVLLHVFAVLQLFTGFQMYVQGLSSGDSSIGRWWPGLLHLMTDWTQAVFGGIGGVRLVHHATTYVILAWVLLHIYYEVSGGGLAVPRRAGGVPGPRRTGRPPVGGRDRRPHLKGWSAMTTHRGDRVPRVLGMGNLLYADEAVGVLAARCLEAAYAFDAPVEVLDGGLLGFGILDLFDDDAPVVVLDGARTDDAPGTLYRVEAEDLLSLTSPMRLAAHEVEPVQQLRIATALGKAPELVLLAVAVRDVELRVGLSEPVAAAVPDLVRHTVAELERWGVGARQVAPVRPHEVLRTLTTAGQP
jgi:Ni/Fe-hydrogenase 1 B-type cytochrome subunit